MSAAAQASHAPRASIEWLGGTDLDVARLGGKGASLNRLAQAGFRIPPGFCLTTDAFAAQIATIPGARVLADDPLALADEPTRTALVEAMLGGPLAASVADALREPLGRLAGQSLGDDPPLLAVRSSSVAEDGTAASFAGLHDTELGLAAADVEPAILRCWASLWSDRAVIDRSRRGLALDGGAMAVVVQALVPALAAAVAFTRHPVTGRSDQVLINAVPGLGEAMVSGLVTPDTIVVAKADRSVTELTPGDSGGGPALADEVLAELITLCLAVEHAFGAPVDIEAAHAADGWYLLQARPITTPRGARMTTPAGDFPITWLEPDDAELAWDWDDMHVPAAVTPLAGDYALVIGAGFAYAYERLEVPYRVRARVWNGYVYYAFTTGLPDSEQAAAADRYTEARRQTIEVSDA
jgi:phosphoenolpyruvate synthase/pyruvate phosphate dikinase